MYGVVWYTLHTSWCVRNHHRTLYVDIGRKGEGEGTEGTEGSRYVTTSRD